MTLMSLLLAAWLLTFTPIPSIASTSDEACSPDSATGCLGGTIRTADGDPAVGVELEIDGPEGTLNAATDDTGRWNVAIGEPGEYTVTVDVDTLPEGESLRNPDDNPRTVTVGLGGTASALFPLGTPTSSPAQEGATNGEDGPDTPAAPGGNGEAEVAPESAAAGGSGGNRVLQLVVSGLIFGLMIALASVGLSLIYGTTSLSNFAHGEQVTLGALVAYFFTRVVGLPLVVSGVLAVCAGLLSGFLQVRTIWGPLRRRGVGITQQMIVTIGLAMAFQYLFNMLAGGGTLRIVTSSPQIITLGPVSLTQQSAISVVIAVVVLTAMALFLTRSRVGRATRAVSDNSALAAASGIDVDRIVRLVWVLGTGLASLGGVLLGLYLSATRWNMGTTLLLLMFAAVTLGGLGTAFGALVGSLVIGLVVELSTLVLPSDMRYAAAMIILVLVLLLRPQGILGRAERVG